MGNWSYAMPAVVFESFLAAAANFPAVVALGWSAGAIAMAETSLAEHGLLLLGECHGVAENPLIVEAVAAAFEIDTLAFEWHSADPLEQPLASAGDGRVTAGHLALVRRTPRRVVGVDTALGRRRDPAMAQALDALEGRVLFVAGNVHTRLAPFGGEPTAGSLLAATRPALCTLDIHYRSGRFWNLGPHRFADPEPIPAGPHVTLGLATEATVLGS